MIIIGILHAVVNLGRAYGMNHFLLKKFASDTVVRYAVYNTYYGYGGIYENLRF